MPMLSKTEVGLVIAIWGQAWVRGADGLFRVLKLGDTLHKGTVVLTAQNAIVQIAPEGDGDEPDRTLAAVDKTNTLDADRAIADINKGSADAAPAAGLGGGDAGDLTPGFRVERISEVAPAGALSRQAGSPDDTAPSELPVGHEPGQVKSSVVTVPPSTVDAVEEGPNVAVGVTMPAGATQIHIDGVPTVGQLLLADGTPVQAGATLTQAQLTGMVYVPPSDYLPGTPVGDLRYSATAGATTAVGSVGFSITPVNDAPLATGGATSGPEDTTIPVSLTGSDVDSPITGITIQQLPSSGTLLLADGVTAVTAGQWMTPAQAAGLLYRPDPNASGTTTITFSVTDDQGATSAAATWTVTVTAVDDLPVVGPDSFTVAEDGSTTINVLANDADPEGNALTVTQVNGTPIVDGGAAVAVLHGSVQLVGGQLVFTPAPNYNGPVNFSYTASDGALSARRDRVGHGERGRRCAGGQRRRVHGRRRRQRDGQRARQRQRPRWRHADDHAGQRCGHRRRWRGGGGARRQRAAGRWPAGVHARARLQRAGRLQLHGIQRQHRVGRIGERHGDAGRRCADRQCAHRADGQRRFAAGVLGRHRQCARASPTSMATP